MIDLWEHQQQAVDKLGPLGSGMLAFDMGAGKSRTALALAVKWRCRRLLIMCPKSVIRVWPKEFAKCGLSNWLVLPLDEGTVKDRAAKVGASFLCADVDDLGLAVALNYESTIREPMASTLAGLPWDLVVYDECHRIKAADGRQSEVARTTARKVPHRLCLSGTPMPHSVLDLFPQFEVINRDIFGTDFWAFRRRFVVTKEQDMRENPRPFGRKMLDLLNALKPPFTPDERAAAVDRFGEPAVACLERSGHVQPTAQALEYLGHRRIDEMLQDPKTAFMRTAVARYKDVDQAQAAIEPWTCRVMTRDVVDLPPVTHMERLCLLGAKARRAHDQAETELRVEIGDGRSVDTACVFAKLTRCAQIANGFLPAKDDEGETEIIELRDEKAELLADVLSDIPADEPVVIFCRFVHDLQVINAVCEKLGRKCGELSGRRNDLAAWQAGDVLDLAVQIQAGGEGIDASRAHYSIYFSVTFSLKDYEQSLKRTDRPGQQSAVFVYHLLAANTIDERVYAALANRREIVGAVMDGLVKQGRRRKSAYKAA